jgi:phosphoglycerate kinase
MNNSHIVTSGDLTGKRILMRVDFNVPVLNDVVQDISRIKNIAPTIDFLKKAKSKIILLSHLSKTGSGKSLKIVVEALAAEYKSNVVFIDDCLSEQAESIIEKASCDDLILLENLRVYPEEEACDAEFARKLARLGDFYINEAFSVSHRKHASVFVLPQLLPHAFGLSFLREINIIDDFLNKAKPPRMSIIGGAKLCTKIRLLKNLVKKVDKLAIGGGIAGAFLSLCGNKSIKIADFEKFSEDVAEILANAKEFGCEIILPVDFSALIEEAESHDSSIISSENGVSVFDIGPASAELFKRHIRESSSVLWNGPVGLFEKEPFSFGTISLAREIANLSRAGKITSIVGGGDTAFAMNKFNVSKYLTYKSTSGGAFLTYLEGSELPGISAMQDAYVLI